MDDGVTIRLDGVPVSWARARRNKQGNHFTAPKVEAFEASFKIAAMQAMKSRAPYDCALSLTATFYMAIPPSWSKRKQEDAGSGVCLPVGKPDLDNLLKGVKDAMNTVVYVDDSRVVDVVACKRYGLKPHVIVTVRPL
jgi:Holliday junction resolvase RusA-like endonuclease